MPNLQREIIVDASFGQIIKTPISLFEIKLFQLLKEQ